MVTVAASSSSSAAAASDPVVVVVTPSAEVVGHAFARQYYTILHQSPGLVYRFYQDMSKLGRVDDDDGTMGSTTTMEAINEKIQSYGTLMADIKSVDAQESFNKGVLVLITGVMIKKDNSRRSFTQTFFLAPQDKGYFVLNDIFRYTEDAVGGKEDSIEEESGKEDGILENDEAKNIYVDPATHEHDASPEQEENISGGEEEFDGEKVLKPSENGENTGVEEEEPVAEVIDEVPSETQVVLESNIKVEEVPKKSYASIVMKQNMPSTSPPALHRTAVRVQDQPLLAAPPPSSIVETSYSGSEVVDDGYNQEVESDGCSVYLRNLPANATPLMVEEALKSFGAIKSGGIQVRNNKGFCFGFVEFESPDSAQNAIEASPVIIGGRHVGVEEKKSTSTRGSGRGRYPSGRGGAFRSEGARGRGNYGGGRGYGRADTVKNEYGKGDTVKNEYSRGEYGRGSGRGFQNRSSDGYQRNDQMGNGFGRGSRGGGPAVNNVARAQRVPASA